MSAVGPDERAGAGGTPGPAPDLALLWQALLREWLAAMRLPAAQGRAEAPAPRASRAAGPDAFDALAHALADVAQAPPGPCDFRVDCGRLGVVEGRVVVAADGASADVALRARRPHTRGLLLLHRDRVQRQASERAGVAVRLVLR